MAVSSGNNGVLQLAATAIAELSTWTLEQTADQPDHTVMNDPARRFTSTTTSWTASIEGWYDITDLGQAELVNGAQVAVTLYPAGDNSTEREWTGTANVATISSSAAVDDIVTFSATLQGTGALVASTVL